MIALVMAAFTVMLTLMIATLTRIETHSSTLKQQEIEAQQNALLALNVALGQLQRHTGPDQRVTGRADVLIPDEVDVPANATGAEAEDSLDAYWNDRRNRHWIGVWRDGNTNGYDPDNPSLSQAEAALQTWLVSGNEDSTTGGGSEPDEDGITPDEPQNFNPTEQVAELAPDSDPKRFIRDAQGRPHHMLVSPGSGDGVDALERAVTAPEVAIENDSGVITGHYAWWVGDEGVKARINLIDAYDDPTPTDTEKLRRIASAQRTAAEAITTEESVGIANFYQPNEERLADVIDLTDLSLLAQQPQQREQYYDVLQERIHDVTISSEGVLADVKHGGLKRDLSYLLGQPDRASMRQVIDAAYGAPVTNTDGANYSRVLSPEITELVAFPSGIGGSGKFDPTADPGMFSYTPTWEQIWSFYNMGNETDDVPAGVFNDSGQAIPRNQTATEHGIHPIITQAKLFYRLQINGTIDVEIIPLVVLANPYSVPLAPSEFQVKLLGPDLEIRYGSTTDPYNPTTDDFGTEDRYKMSNSGLTHVTFTLETPVMAPGEAQIYTLAAQSTVVPSSESAQKSTEFLMENDFWPDAHLVINTNESIPPPDPEAPSDEQDMYAVLYMGSPDMRSFLMHNFEPEDVDVFDDRKLLQYIQSWAPSTQASQSRFVVYPTSNGEEKIGGGASFALNDLYFNKYYGLHSAPFYQQNFRSNIVDGFHGYTGPTHLLQTALAQGKSGAAGNHEYIGAHLLRPSGSLTQARWGPINTGVGNYETVAPEIFNSPDVGLVNLLYDVPTEEVSLASLGQMQHLNTNAFIDRGNWKHSSVNGRKVGETTTVQSWQVNYPISNSYAHPRVPRDQIMNNFVSGYFYDGSYIWNDLLWDQFYFSTYPASGDFDFADDQLVNARYHPFRPIDEVPLDDTDSFRGADGNLADSANSRMAAQNLLAAGAFNVNSTSPEAWKAIFSALRDVEIGSETDSNNLTAPFTRVLDPIGGSENAQYADQPNAWSGFRNLTQEEIDELAEEMVLQVRRRGPFLSMSDFVNRSLITSEEDTYDVGLSGALQSAIDAVVNQTDEMVLDQGSEDANLITKLTSGHANHVVDNEFRMPSVAGYPGYLLQADVLSAIGAHLTARSDTFRIRTYGDAVNPLTQEVEARAWCEAIVQRVPDYVAADDEPHEDAQHPDNLKFGRRYKIVSFRWLTPNEI